MKNPDRDLVKDIMNDLLNEKEEQVKGFVISHLDNSRNSDEPQMLQWVTAFWHVQVQKPPDLSFNKILLNRHDCSPANL